MSIDELILREKVSNTLKNNGVFTIEDLHEVIATRGLKSLRGCGETTEREVLAALKQFEENAEKEKEKKTVVEERPKQLITAAPKLYTIIINGRKPEYLIGGGKIVKFKDVKPVPMLSEINYQKGNFEIDVPKDGKSSLVLRINGKVMAHYTISK